MDNRKFESGASASPPSAPVSPSSGYPTNGNPGTGTPATVPGEWWFHQVGEELRGVITAAGLTPAHTDVTQLLAALRSTGVFLTPPPFDNTTRAATTAFVRNELLNLGGVAYDALFGRLLADNGYQKFPGGLIIQWGSGSASANLTSTSITFPIAFPNAVFSVVCLTSAEANAITSVWRVSGSLSNTGFSYAIEHGALGNNQTWVAIGY